MKNKVLLLAALFFSASMSAETYTIVFKSGNGSNDSGTRVSDLNKIVLEATDNCAESVILANNIYNAGSERGIKGGTGTAKGELTLGLNTTYTISTMTIYAASYKHKNDTTATKGISVCGQNILWEAGHRAELRPYTITLNQNLNEISIAALVASNNRWYVQRIEFDAPDPLPNTAVFERPYDVDFGSVPIEDGEASEDIVNILVKGKHVVGDIQLALKSGKIFSLGSTTLPAEGGEVDIAYSIRYVSTIYDTLYISGKGTDNVLVTKSVPLKIGSYKYTPPTFDVDSSCMAIGPMPGFYYEQAQGTQDSVLKSRLGEIIFCGVRYRYGSGNRRTWHGFFFTDRDTVTNEVLDMYSNNHRYFNPQDTTASVAGFDIEHMLPKSWWGRTVNEAYCDLFHLVPGDYSANRSKSNHAPGVPSDTTFWNGSFATGNVSIDLNGTSTTIKVFSPADEYKGDFARAYFYIATCYGDALKWEESGEPKQAMTNEGWQEFQPWLRDLLVQWNRLDPVSEKEKARAIEVNKIQGNRNPFIDYPELVEYIWGNKQGQPVDFYNLVQSYGDPYGGTQAIEDVCNSSEGQTARKEIREGQIVIVRNSAVYTVLGQSLQSAQNK